MEGDELRAGGKLGGVCVTRRTLRTQLGEGALEGVKFYPKK